MESNDYPCELVFLPDGPRCECLVGASPVLGHPELVRQKNIKTIYYGANPSNGFNNDKAVSITLLLLKCGDTYSVVESKHYSGGSSNGLRTEEILEQSTTLEDIVDNFDYPILQ